eukprot:CAMPEP_0171504132 /NCGR_PEP_ID=MMETSP0958-20121227/11365_1 /TAXON_ID=87120 /ORGANISM="Aurantiochytrium limacinum, Strain ATCCMYA-1381" /LENGTH=73 /DNA_ID=CAMNT_0012039867 /DNA_START=596 /DNA_END=818 /DNA_ORIENTATION=-
MECRGVPWNAMEEWMSALMEQELRFLAALCWSASQMSLTQARKQPQPQKPSSNGSEGGTPYECAALTSCRGAG